MNHRGGTKAGGNETEGDQQTRRVVLAARTTSKAAVPGKFKARQANKKKRRSFWSRCYKRWFRDTFATFSSLFLAVILWYTLGVLSITTSKLLLTRYTDFVSPLVLTFQQLIIGSSVLRFLLRIQFLGMTKGLQPWPHHPATAGTQWHSHHHTAKSRSTTILSQLHKTPPYLILAGIYFSLGFLATNFGFSGTNAAFVESIKAAEPITSALIAVGWGIENLSRPEALSLCTLVLGVFVSTVGNEANSHQSDSGQPFASLRSCLIVMLSNLCFSFRGLYQKLLKNEGTNVDDVNLQFRMQQVGVIGLSLPLLLFESVNVGKTLVSSLTPREFASNLQFIGLALVNGFAFTSYNLASTFILSRISVIHHATLNCIRRVFAVVVTSIAFSVPITFLSTSGILISVGSFMSFTHFKVQRQKQPKPLSSLLPVSNVN